jgi:Helix-turn-helix domain
LKISRPLIILHNTFYIYRITMTNRWRDWFNNWRTWKEQHPDFPLTIHSSGRWSKRVHGKVYFYGPLHNPDKALQRWLRERNRLLTGITPKTRIEKITMENESLKAIGLEKIAEKVDAICSKADALFTRYSRAASGPKLHTLEEAAEILGVTKRAVDSMLNRSLLSWVDVSATKGSKKHHKRILESDLLAFIESRKHVTSLLMRPYRVRRRRQRIAADNMNHKQEPLQ